MVTLAGSAPASAESRSAQMNVSATVVARTILSVNSPAEVVVSNEDVTRGYVVLAAPLSFSVHSNSLGGYLLRFSTLDPQFSGATISWSATEVVVSGGEGQIAQPYHKGITPYSATVRLDLAPGTQPGTYAWPLHIAADTL